MQSYPNVSRCLPALLALALFGCSDDADDKSPDKPTTEQPFTCGEELTGEFQASEWVRAASDIESYRYTVTADRNTVRFELLDDTRALLADMDVTAKTIGETEKNLADLADPDQAVLEAVLQPPDTTPITLQASEALSPDGDFRVLLDMERGERRIHMVADFGEETCEPTPELDNQPACLGALKLDETALTLPSCGFSRDEYGQELVATTVSYYTPPESPVTPLDFSGIRQLAGEQFHTVRPLDLGRSLASDNVADWLQETGADAIIGTDEEHLLSVAFLDQPWTGVVQEHTNYCKSPDVFPTLTNNLCETATATGELARRTQPLSGRNSCITNMGPLWSPPGDDPDGFDFKCKGIGCLGWVWGDPHLQTHDGVAFDFQGAGEYVLTESLEGAPLLVQGRFEPMREAPDLPACGNVTVMTAVATTLGERRIGIYRDRDPSLWIDGAPHQLGVDELDLPDGAEFGKTGTGTYVAKWPNGDSIRVRVGNFMRIDFLVMPGRIGQVAGLLGFYNGDGSDDFVTRDGQQLSAPLEFETKYDTFGESWRVAEADDSLFDYDDAEGPDDFYIAGFPSAPAKIDDFPDQLATEARDVCTERDISDPVRLEACILDYVCSQDPTLADDAAEIPDPSAVMEDPFLLIGQVRAVHTAEQWTTPDDRENRCQPPIRTAFIHQEAVDVTLTVPLVFDLPTVTIDAGEVLSSYFVHLPAHADDAEPIAGTIVFRDEVVGVLRTNESLDASADFAKPDFDYPDSNGLEDGADFVLIGEDGRSVSFELDAGDDPDQLRILVKTEAP